MQMYEEVLNRANKNEIIFYQTVIFNSDEEIIPFY